ncbi:MULTISPECIES: lysine 2,3-aminomutase [unclassified Streptomyces]|uniref:KamA family radical SAM protein n=1 Tax=unclassified Streptomyces TaxID=2593676 RepID=UPI0009965C50|nr:MULTISPECIES: lysine 2,3-aminomutase [unclassified Streptomyces]SNB88044.1 L-lysine 2,3-aminomutase [Streptomyces sp. PgraA7]
MKHYANERLARLALDRGMPEPYVRDLRVVGSVLPFKVNEYVADELIDWSAAPDDPIFRLTFPHRDMLPPDVFDRMAALVDGDAPRDELRRAAAEAQLELNPHPGGQLEANVPMLDGRRLDGLQHKYAETVLVFPSQGQTCHSYCGYCFRWAQFVSQSSLRQALRDPADLTGYLAQHPEVTDVLFTGGDPMIMRTDVVRRWVEPLLADDARAVRTLRFGTKALSYWPARFTTGPDADDLLRLFEQAVAAGRHVAVMAHFSHPRELETDAVREAVARIRSTGAVIRAQAPLVAHVNDDAAAWARMWQQQVELGIVPYYMFVERDTGARNYFGLPLARALEIYTEAISGVSGLARTARGPVMSAGPGKVMIHGTADVGGERAFVLSFLQARRPDWVGRPFFAAWDEQAQWYDDLKPLSASGTVFPPFPEIAA